ncbi:MAG: chorismate-binding protein [Marinoscillum sp.]
MQINQVNTLRHISKRSEAEDFLRSILFTPYPVAIWRLPNQGNINALVDLTMNEEPTNLELENLNKSFVINSYHDSHPVKAITLEGHILVKIEGSDAQLEVNPTLTGSQIESFEGVLSNSLKLLKPGIKDGNHPDFESMVAEAIEKIKQGNLHKVVLSRYKDFELQESFDPIDTFDELTRSYPNAFCSLTNTKTYGLWIGASPEKLIAIDNDRFFSTDALAGTQSLPSDKDLCDVAWTQKEIEEQAMVSRYIIDCFKKIRLREFDENGPKTVKAGNLAHLKTEYKVDMQATSSPQLGSTMLELLHPTSAVCGAPRDLADDFIKSHEDYDRSLYAGFLGPVGFDSKTSLFVNLRCMQVIGNTARLYAGAGITEDSVPARELAETDQKMETLLKVLGL